MPLNAKQFEVYFIPEMDEARADTNPLVVECEYVTSDGTSYFFRDGDKAKDVKAIVPVNNVLFLQTRRQKEGQ